MKAKEYAEIFMKEKMSLGINQAIFNIYKEMFLEVGDLRIARKARTGSALTAIFREQSLKWKAICRIVNPLILQDNVKLEPEGFMKLAEKKMGFKFDV